MDHIRSAPSVAARHAHYAWDSAQRFARKVDEAVTHGARAAIHVARHVDKGVQLTRPLYTHVARPLLRHGGIATAPLDRALSTYDSIRRAVI
ncbi:MAG TPA: hypothetical protein PLB88_11080 [Thermoanaerobaculaceae bacterium]|nr:hypothetical protein [Thermoanaerobaculaceae bacterium]